MRKTLQKKMTTEGYKSFISYKGHGGIIRRLRMIKYSWLLLPTYINVFNNKIGIHFRLKQHALRVSNPGAPADLFHWGMKIMIERYRRALS